MKALALAAALVATAGMASAEAKCGPTEKVHKLLAEKYSEAEVFHGVTSDGAIFLQIWINPETGSWTATGTRGDGMTCLMASGGAGETISYVAPAEGDPA